MANEVSKNLTFQADFNNVKLAFVKSGPKKVSAKKCFARKIVFGLIKRKKISSHRRVNVYFL